MTREQCREHTRQEDKVQQCMMECSDCQGPVLHVLSGEGPGEGRVAFVLEGQARFGPEESVCQLGHSGVQGDDVGEGPAQSCWQQRPHVGGLFPVVCAGRGVLGTQETQPSLRASRKGQTGAPVSSAHVHSSVRNVFALDRQTLEDSLWFS